MKQIPRITLVCANGGTVEKVGDPISPNKGVYTGIICMIKVVTPNVNSITFTIRLYDRNGVLVWQSAALAENSGVTGYSIPVNLPITEKEYFSAQASGDPGSAASITIDCDYLGDYLY